MVQGGEDMTEREFAELAAELGLTEAEAQVVWTAAREGLAAETPPAGQPDEDQLAISFGERLDAGSLLADLLSSGGKPDLAEIARKELAKAVAKKLDIDQQQAEAMVAAAADMLGVSGSKPRRKRPKSDGASAKPKPSTGSTPKPAAKPKPSTGSTAKPAAKPKPTTGSTAKPAAKPKPSTGSTAKPTAKPKPSTGSTAKPAAKPKPTTGSTAKPKPTTGSTAKPKPRQRTVTAQEGEDSDT